MSHNFCSIYSDEYLYKGLLLYRSLEKHDEDFVFYFIFLSDTARQVFEALNLNKAVCLSIRDIEEYDSALADVKTDRNTKEYIWTAKASAMLYLFARYESLDHIIWLDGDTFFYGSPEPVYEEWGKASILLTEEGFNGSYEYLALRNGVYNTGLMGFRRDQESEKCLKYFRDKLIEWCYDRHEPGLWSDQLHVSDWPDRFNSVGIVKNPGINLTPFRLFRITTEEKGEVKRNGEDIYINDVKLILFHYYGFRYFDGEQYELCFYEMYLSDQSIKELYYSYAYAAIEAVGTIRNISGEYYRECQRADIPINNYFNLKVDSGLTIDVISFFTVIKADTVRKGLLLYYSIREKVKAFRLWVCCMDNESFRLISSMQLANVTAVHFKNIASEELKVIHETCGGEELAELIKPFFLAYVTKNNINIGRIVFMNCDYCLLADPSAVFTGEPYSPVYLIGCRQSQSMPVILFRRSKEYFDFLYLWKKKCLEGCLRNKGKGTSAMLFINELQRRLFKGIKPAGGFIVCEGGYAMNYIRHDNDGNRFYLKQAQVMAVKPFPGSRKVPDRLDAAMPEGLWEYVYKLIKAEEKH